VPSDAPLPVIPSQALTQLLTCSMLLFLDVTLGFFFPLPLWIAGMLGLVSDCGIADVEGLGCIFRI